MADEPVTLEFLAAQQRKILAELSAVRDDMRVMSAIVMRQDGSLSAIVDQLRAMVQQQSRFADRILALEDRPR